MCSLQMSAQMSSTFRWGKQSSLCVSQWSPSYLCQRNHLCSAWMTIAHCIQAYHYEVLQVTNYEAHKQQSSKHTGPIFVCLPSQSHPNAMSATLHLSLTQLDKNKYYVKMLFIDFRSAFNTIPQHLKTKLSLVHLSLLNFYLYNTFNNVKIIKVICIILLIRGRKCTSLSAYDPATRTNCCLGFACVCVSPL